MAASPLLHTNCSSFTSHALPQSKTRPRLVDVVIWGGPHYDEVLQVRMHELSELVDLFVIIEHTRPMSSSMVAARRFDWGKPWLVPFANRTRHFRLSTDAAPSDAGLVPRGCLETAGRTACAPVHEFLDLDIQSFDDRERVVNAAQVAYAEVAQPHDLVLLGDIDGIPRSSVLASILHDGKALA